MTWTCRWPSDAHRRREKGDHLIQQLFTYLGALALNQRTLDRSSCVQTRQQHWAL